MNTYARFWLFSYPLPIVDNLTNLSVVSHGLPRLLELSRPSGGLGGCGGAKVDVTVSSGSGVPATLPVASNGARWEIGQVTGKVTAAPTGKSTGVGTSVSGNWA